MSEFVCPHCGGKIGVLKVTDSKDPAPIDFNKLPWKPFRTGKGEWVFAGLAETDSNAKALLKQLEASETKELERGPYRYRLSVGNNGKTAFIHRFPLEVK